MVSPSSIHLTVWHSGHSRLVWSTMMCPVDEAVRWEGRRSGLLDVHFKEHGPVVWDCDVDSALGHKFVCFPIVGWKLTKSVNYWCPASECAECVIWRRPARRGYQSAR